MVFYLIFHIICILIVSRAIQNGIYAGRTNYEELSTPLSRSMFVVFILIFAPLLVFAGLLTAVSGLSRDNKEQQ